MQRRPTATPESLPPVTIGVVSHNTEAVIGDCLDSLTRLDYPRYELLFVDNASSDGTPHRIRERFPGARLIRLAKNEGPNPARNLILRTAAHRHVLLVEDDVLFEPGALRGLVAAMTADPRCGIAMGRILFADSGAIQYSDIHPHFLGEVTIRNQGKPPAACTSATRPTTLAPGCFLLVDRVKASEIGGFDEYYVFGKEDSDFAFRMTLAGYTNLEVPATLVRHKVKPRGFTRSYHQLRNRWYWILKLFSTRTLLLTAPALLVHELVTLAFFVRARQLGDYSRALAAFPASLPEALRARRRTLALKCVPDRAVLTAEAMQVRSDVLRPGSTAWKLKRNYDAGMALYWRLVRRLL
ncbi:MAG: glycosyltransferase family 2 protein [Gemmatimonadota bacterium]